MAARGRRRRRALLVGLSVTALLLTGTACTSETDAPGSAAYRSPPPAVDGSPFRAFTGDSWWNTPVPDDAPVNPQQSAILRYMSTAREAGGGCLRMSGAEDGSWGQPVYWAGSGDPEFDLHVDGVRNAPHLPSLRIPRDAESADNSDGSMTLFDVERGYVVALTDATYDAARHRWSASGATITYLASDGLDARIGGASDDRNTGTHRGNNGAVMMARYDEVDAGHIDHVLKVASGPEVSASAVFPMVGSDGDSDDPAAPPQGLRFRIKPSVDLDKLGLDPEALIIATALQRYGFYIGDSAGVTALKLEDTRREGRGQLWSVSSTALCSVPLTPQYWDELPEGYRPPT
jgi:hypothetical protein